MLIPDIARLVPHQGRMCLLERVVGWTADRIDCTARSHLDPDNPLRRKGRLAALSGIEYGLQAAAAHGALTAGPDGPPGWLAAVRDVDLAVAFLDDPAFGALHVEARLLLRDRSGWIYGFSLTAEDGRPLATGRGTILIPPMRDEAGLT